MSLQPLLGHPASVMKDAATVIDPDGSILYNDEHLGTICIFDGGIPGVVDLGGSTS